MRISIIIPVYNVAAFILKCIEAVHHQTYKDIEVIFVDKAEARRILAEEKVSARASFMLMIFINSDEDKPFDFLNK